jgi:glutamate synthase (NADPH/NADH) large chain
MTGGELFLYDPDGKTRLNLHADVEATNLKPESEQSLKEILGDFFEEAKSPCAAAILENWNESRANFVYVTPR